MNYPEDLKYTREHEWVRKNEDGTATVGITDFAQSELGDVVFIEVDTVGQDLSKDEVFGTVEAVKTVSDLFMPAAGEITELNAKIENNPELVNEDPYGDGWMVRIRLSDPSQLDELLSSDDYQKIIS
ncbi:MAG: glycine cleavage system protein GcvH [Balneolales bacterium]